MNKYDDAIKIMTERFGKDEIVAIATISGKDHEVRFVNGYYEDGAFYTITYTLSTKMQHIAVNPEVAVCTFWFTGHGIGESLGWVRDEKNKELLSKLRTVYASWYDDNHIKGEEDPNMCILRIRLTDGVLIDHERKYGVGRYEIDFVNRRVMELSSPSKYQIESLQDEGRTGVIKITNPENWAVVNYDLGAYKDQNITIKFVADVKRVGAAGTLNWQVNNEDYPSVGIPLDNAAADTWHTMSGEWTGTPTDASPSFFLSTYENNSKSTTYYIDNFNITITPTA